MSRPTGRPVLLDTCACIYLVEGAAMAEPALMAIRRAEQAGGVMISPVSAWEIGLLSRRANGRLAFLPNPTVWFERLMAGPAVRPAPFDAPIAIASSWLPGTIHGDPADRFLVATARHLAMPIITRDRLILRYAAVGHVEAIAC